MFIAETEIWPNFAMECKKRRAILESASNEKFQSYNISVIPRSENQRVDGSGYGGGLSDAYNKIRMLQRELDSFEEKHINKFLLTKIRMVI